MATPIEQAKNLGPVTGAECRSVGVETAEQLQDIGWEEAWQRIVEAYPERRHLMMGCALLGAEEGIDCRELSATQKDKVRRVQRRLGA